MGEFSYGNDPVEIAATENIVLERLRVLRGDQERYRLHRSITYRTTDARTGETTTYIVPPDDEFETDLTSVPQLLTWLVPKSGRHLPAALVHDALVDDDRIDRFEADRVFRDGMGDLGVGLVRRWLMWTAVTMATVFERQGWRHRLVAAVTGLVIVALGTLATINLATDRTLVPWMGDRGVPAELALGLAGAVVIPIVLAGTLWTRVRLAGAIAGVAIAVLLHAMVMTAGVYGLYLLLERLPRWAQAALGTVVVTASAVAFGYALATALT